MHLGGILACSVISWPCFPAIIPKLTLSKSSPTIHRNIYKATLWLKKQCYTVLWLAPENFSWSNTFSKNGRHQQVKITNCDSTSGRSQKFVLGV